MPHSACIIAADPVCLALTVSVSVIITSYKAICWFILCDLCTTQFSKQAKNGSKILFTKYWLMQSCFMSIFVDISRGLVESNKSYLCCISWYVPFGYLSCLLVAVVLRPAIRTLSRCFHVHMPYSHIILKVVLQDLGFQNRMGNCYAMELLEAKFRGNPLSLCR